MVKSLPYVRVLLVNESCWIPISRAKALFRKCRRPFWACATKQTSTFDLSIDSGKIGRIHTRCSILPEYIWISIHLISNDLHLNQCCFNKVTIIRTLHKMVPYSSKWSSETGRQYFSSSSLSSSRDMDPSLSPSTPRYAEAIAFQLSVIFARKMSSTWQNHSGFDSTDYISTCM